MGDGCCRGTTAARTMLGGSMALKLTIVMAIAAVAICDESLISKDDMTKMSKEQLVSALQKAQSHNADISKQLMKEKKEVANLSYEEDEPTDMEETKRKSSEKTKKAAVKKAHAAKRAAKMKKTTKLSDILMDHGAKYLAFIAAKQNKNSGSVKQQKATILAAKKGGRAGAVGPLRKVVHNAAVAAAKAAVHKILKEQEALIEKAAKKWTDAAIKKFPPSVHLAKAGKPNKFSAPPTIHLLMQPPSADDVVPEN